VTDATLLAALVLVVRNRMGRLGKRTGPESVASPSDRPEEHGVRSVGEFASSLNPLHHDPLPPFPGAPDNEAE
jgi:hypothetical protein